MQKTVAVIENNIIATSTIRKTLMRALQGNGYRVVVLSTGRPEALDLARSDGFEVVDIGGSTHGPLEIFTYLRNLRRALKQAGADAALTFTIRPAIWGNFVTRLLDIPTISNITGIGPLFERNDIAYCSARTLYRFALKKTAYVFFQNHDDRDIFVSKCLVDPARSERIPGSGVDTAFYAPMDVERRQGFTFLFVGRLVKDKGIGEYVEAAARLKAIFQNVHCQVLGPLWEQNLKDNTVTVTELAAWQAEGTIEYLGEQQDVRPSMAAADCVVLPSYREGASNVLLEASSMERPCITCNTTGCREIVIDGTTGLLCRARDADDLADKMAKMHGLSEQERASMGRNGRQKVLREFDKATVVAAYLRILEKVLA